VLEAQDGAEALGVLSESKPDLVILDWDLAILSGEEFVRLTRTPTTSPAPTVPIILMLSKPRRYAVDRSVALGVNEIIAKPFSPKVLWSRLDEVINRPRPFVQVKGLLRPVARSSNTADKAAA
jgi:two-component system, chemotaxis family, chemotaxis protein CheY